MAAGDMEQNVAKVTKPELLDQERQFVHTLKAGGSISGITSQTRSALGGAREAQSVSS
jgi:hypothetical protein